MITFAKKLATDQPVVYSLKLQCQKRVDDKLETYYLSAFGSRNALLDFMDGRTEVKSMEVRRHQFGFKPASGTMGMISNLKEAFKELTNALDQEVLRGVEAKN